MVKYILNEKIQQGSRVAVAPVLDSIVESLRKLNENYNDNSRRLINPSAHAPMEIPLPLSFSASVLVR